MEVLEAHRKWVWRRVAQNGEKWRKMPQNVGNLRNLAVELLFLLVKHLWNLTCTFFYASLHLYKTYISIRLSVGWLVRQSVRPSIILVLKG